MKQALNCEPVFFEKSTVWYYKLNAPKVASEEKNLILGIYMKLLMIYADHFGYQTALKTLPDIPDVSKSETIKSAVLGFIHVEEKDNENTSKVITKMIKNLKWLAGKNNTKKIVLHSFSHLSESKAESEIVVDIFNQSEQRLKNSGYQVSQTPVGYFLDIDLQAPGTPLARVFKDI